MNYVSLLNSFSTNDDDSLLLFKRKRAIQGSFRIINKYASQLSCSQNHISYRNEIVRYYR